MLSAVDAGLVEAVPADGGLREAQALLVLSSRLLLKPIFTVLHLVDHWTKCTEIKSIG